MAKIYAKCPNCDEIILIEDNQEADVCEKCNKAFIVQKAIMLYSGNSDSKKEETIVKKRHVLKSLGLGLLLALKCAGYLIYVLCCLWLFFDIVDDLKKK